MIWSSLYSVRLMRWSVTRFSGKLYVRIRWLRSPEPTSVLRSVGPLLVLFLALVLVDAAS